MHDIEKIDPEQFEPMDLRQGRRWGAQREEKPYKNFFYLTEKVLQFGFHTNEKTYNVFSAERFCELHDNKQ